MVVAGVLIVAHTDERPFQELDHESQYLAAGQAWRGQVTIGVHTDLWQGSAERHHPVVLGGVADLPPPGMVSVLLAPSLIPARCLDMPQRRWTDPDLLPRRWDRKALDSCEGLPITDCVTVR